MSTRVLLIATAVIEVGAGIALLGVPSLAAEVLLGEGLSSPQSVVVARVAGVALISLGFACWLARSCDRISQNVLIAGMLIYNVGVPVLLLYGWFATALAGLALWPATVLHVGLAIWCGVSLRGGHS